MINRPAPGPSVPVQEPVVHVVPKMAPVIKMVAPTVWRVNEVEIEGLSRWLVPMLQVKWPRLQEESIIVWLKQHIWDRNAYFIRTRHSVGLFLIQKDVLEPQPIVLEKFVRGNDEATKAEYDDLYSAARDWAQDIKARELWFGLDTSAGMQRSTSGEGVVVTLQDDRKNSNVKKASFYKAVFV